jgi:hypothetical protein
LTAHYAWLAGDTLDAITAYNLKSFAYEVIGKTELAAKIHSTAMQMFTKWGYKQQAAGISADCMDYLLQRHEFAKAKKLFYLYERESGYFSHGQVTRGKEVYYYIKGKYYLAVNQYDSAQYLFRKCMDYMDDPNTKVAAYHGLSMLYNKMQIPDSTAKYAMLAYDANDSSFQYNTAATLMRIQSLYNYSKHQADALQSAQKTASLQRWLLGLTFTVILLVLISYYIYTRRKRIMQQRIALIQERYETEKTLLQQEMQELYALLEERQALLDDKDNLLQHKQEELNSEIDKREESIAQLQKRVLDYEREMNMKDLAEQEDKIQNTPLKAHFQLYLKNVTTHPSAKEWGQLSKFAKIELPKLYMMLNNYSVTEYEFRICILTRLKFKPKEVSVIVDCSFSEVTLTRTRLLKKIYGIEVNPAISTNASCSCINGNGSLTQRDYPN